MKEQLEQVIQTLNLIQTTLGEVEVRRDAVYHMADSRRSLQNVIDYLSSITSTIEATVEPTTDAVFDADKEDL